MVWSLYAKSKKEGDKDLFLKPLKFSNGKTQEDVVKEVLEKINSGEKIIFIQGVCGTGKSGIALNIAKELGKTSVVVPIKNLQEQYKQDYEGNKYVLKSSGKKLKISVITGRKNYKCKYLEDQKLMEPTIKKEVNSKLSNIFEKKEDYEKDLSADNWEIPCKIEIKEKNWKKIRAYLQENPRVDSKNFEKMSDIKRASVAGACPYWCPVLPEKYKLAGFPDNKRKLYEGLEDTEYALNCGTPGCKFYEQYHAYVDSDVIVFNSLKYKLETLLKRKPKTEVEVIDECDEFLDSFSNQRNINLGRLQNALIYVLGQNEKVKKSVDEIRAITNHLGKDSNVQEAVYKDKIMPLKNTGIYDILQIILKTPEILDEVDNESYLMEVEETAKMFEDVLNESYVSFEKKENWMSASIVTINLAKRFKELVNKNKTVVLMSGTLHSEEVLKKIFGLQNFQIIQAENKSQGDIKIEKTGKEINCKYSNFYSKKHTREEYLIALEECIKKSVRPTLVHINSFYDLPSEEEKEKFKINSLKSREKVREEQKEDSVGKLVKDFKEGKTEVFFSTRASRGLDFPGNQCRSIVFTKFPNPDVKDAFWKILRQTKPQYYWMFYRDKARRELLQKLYRGLRTKEDYISLLSPDIRVLEEFEKMDFKK